MDCLDKLKSGFEYLFEAELIEQMCRYGKLKLFPKNSAIIHVGDTLDFFPIVLSGSIKVMTEDKEGDELLLYYLESGDTCAVTLNCCTKKSKSKITAITETDAEILMISLEHFEKWMVDYDSWRRFILDSYNIRLNEMLEAIDNLVFNDMEERLKIYLKDKMWMNKSDVLHITHSDIANDLHSSRVVISRIMKKLEKLEFLQQSRNQVKILSK